MENKFEPSEETIEQLNAVIKAAYDMANAIAEVVKLAIEVIRRIAIELGKFFLKQQLLEWRMPYPVAEMIAKKMPWYWSWKIGFYWFQRKMLALE